MRLFAALWPPEHVLDHLEAALSGVMGPAHSGPPALRRVPRENLHITLAFYGEIPDGAASDVREALAEEATTTAPLHLRLSGSGSFSERSLWIGLAGEVPALTELMGACARAPYLTEEGGSRRPRPHLTVARSSRRAAPGGPAGRSRRRGDREALGPSAMATAARALAVYRGPDWVAEEIALVASYLGGGPGGAPRYEVLDSLELGR
ncbi:RNA 2',3'-cyclic phosphodiesterase [Ruania alkalisoli]|uniref:RNA 2',3'-cyclic phosphodiesterase n=1 Tax=Ruania alkalisoli TaxID=2779775 RepID=A0A7M1SX67_9MICO|nr:RNA 2',3'-cyclic phosphodiesterase [Ruania alkalisoli]QOR72180.1 RNA 2',3'-cyclic phosphodiesterase [Ruania alkalisoli]